MHVELFLQLQAHDIKGKLGTPVKKSNFNFNPSPPILALFLRNAPPPPLLPILGLVFQPPLLIVIAQSLIKCSETAGEVNRDGFGQKQIRGYMLLIWVDDVFFFKYLNLCKLQAFTYMTYNSSMEQSSGP